MRSGSKAQWDGLVSRGVLWVRGDPLYLGVTNEVLSWEKVPQILRKLGVPYGVYLEIVEDAFGKDRVFCASVLGNRNLTGGSEDAPVGCYKKIAGSSENPPFVASFVRRGDGLRCLNSPD